jgi:hypothetical protein
MKEPEPDIRQDKESPFNRFAKTLLSLMGVTKRELDQQLAEEKREQKPQQRRGRKCG